MDFSLSDEQRQLKDSVERFIRERYPFEQWRKIVAADAGAPDEHWRQMADLGWLGVSFPEAYGGLDGGAVETMVIMEGLGQGLALEPYLSTVVLGGGLIARAGSETQKKSLLPQIAEGSLKLALALAEPKARFDFDDVALKADRANGGYVLTGEKCVVFDAPVANRIIVSARTSGKQRQKSGISLFLVDAKAPGIEMRRYRTLDHRQAADLRFNRVTLGSADLIGPIDKAFPLIQEMLDHGLAALAAEAVGAMQVLCDTTNDYLKTRKQFGVPIGSFQVLQHRMVDMWIALEQARSMAYMATLKLARAKERTKAAAAAKTTIGRSGRFVGYQAIQLHGGMGMSDEYKVNHYTKRLMMIDTLFGPADHHRARFADLT